MKLYVCVGMDMIQLCKHPGFLVLNMQNIKILQHSLNYLTELTNIIALYYFWVAPVFLLGYQNMSLSCSSISEIVQGRTFEKVVYYDQMA